MKEPDEVVSWACNLTDSIIAGEHNMPKEMIYCINNLQDAVYSYLRHNGLHLKNCLTKDYEQVRDNARKEREDKLRQMYQA